MTSTGVVEVAGVFEGARRARAALPALAAMDVSGRAAALKRLRRQLMERDDELVALLVREGGKVPTEARVFDVGVAAATASWAAVEGPGILATTTPSTFVPKALRKARVSRVPHGVCGLLSPWNYPLAIPMGTIAPALLAGNTVLWKPSEHVPEISRALVACVRDAGFPADALVVVDGGPEVGADLVQADIDHLTFVGGERAGRLVAAAAGARLLPAIIELGGKAPCIVVDDEHLERAARAIVFGGLMNGGQSCVAVERVYAVDAVFDALTDRVRALAGTLRPGQERGRAMLKSQAAWIAVAVADAEADAGPAGLAPNHAHARGPVVDVTAQPESPLLQEECFGAVIPCVRVRDVDEAVFLSNAHRLQLAAYVFGEAKQARAIAARLKAPMVGINDVMLHYGLPQLPFGGVGGSGFGRVHGAEGLLALTTSRVVVEAPSFAPDREPWWQPYARDGRAELTLIDKALAVYERLRR